MPDHFATQTVELRPVLLGRRLFRPGLILPIARNSVTRGLEENGLTPISCPASSAVFPMAPASLIARYIRSRRISALGAIASAASREVVGSFQPGVPPYGESIVSEYRPNSTLLFIQRIETIIVGKLFGSRVASLIDSTAAVHQSSKQSLVAPRARMIPQPMFAALRQIDRFVLRHAELSYLECFKSRRMSA